jgi:hypothetical protein
MRDLEWQWEVVGRWLRYAREDLEAAWLIVEHDSVPRAACLHAWCLDGLPGMCPVVILSCRGYRIDIKTRSLEDA